MTKQNVKYRWLACAPLYGSDISAAGTFGSPTSSLLPVHKLESCRRHCRSREDVEQLKRKLQPDTGKWVSLASCGRYQVVGTGQV